MSIFDALDATRICARWTVPEAERAVVSPPVAPPPVPETTEPARYSWWSLIGNPQAMLMTGLIGTGVAADALLRLVAPAGAR